MIVYSSENDLTSTPMPIFNSLQNDQNNKQVEVSKNKQHEKSEKKQVFIFFNIL